MGKNAERQAAEARRQTAQGLLDAFRNGTQNFGKTLVGIVDSELMSGSRLKKQFKISGDAIKRGRDGKSTGVEGEIREKLLRTVCQETGAAYYQRRDGQGMTNTKDKLLQQQAMQQQ